VHRRLIVFIGIFSLCCCFLYAALSISTVNTAVFKRIVACKCRWFMKDKIVKGWSGWLFFEPELTYVTGELPPENVQSIIAFDRVLREQGIILFVVPIPNKIDIYPEKFTLLPVSGTIKKARSDMLARLETGGVRVVDLEPVFKNAKSFGQIFDPYETHWTALGIEVAAAAIARRLDSALIARGVAYKTAYRSRDTILKTCGDLLDKLNGNRFSTWYPFPVTRVLRPDDSLYTDDRRSEIMILGDSFVNHGKWWNAHLGAQIARFIHHPTRTYFSLQANTEGPCMYRLKPAVFPAGGIVVWAFTSRVLQFRMGDPRPTARTRP